MTIFLEDLTLITLRIFPAELAKNITLRLLKLIYSLNLINLFASSKIEKSKINRLLLCSGKIYFELDDYIEKRRLENIQILRFDQLYPFPYEALKEELLEYPQAEIYWVQEEPSNMGAFRFVKHRVESVNQSITGKYEELLFIGRKASASPATGIALSLIHI